MKTGNQPNDSVNPFDEIVHDLMKQSFATTDSTTKQITRVEKELIGGRENDYSSPRAPDSTPARHPFTHTYLITAGFDR